MLHRSNTESMNNVVLYPDRPRYRWERDLPVLVGEGTGYMDPLVKPVECYYKGNMDHPMAKNFVDKLSVIKNIYLNTNLTKGHGLQVKRPQLRIKDEGKHKYRMNTFYREVVYSFSSKWIREGYDFGEFIWATKLEKEGCFEYGVTMRDRLYSNNDLVLIVSGKPTEEEWNVYMSLLKLVPPPENPTFATPSQKVDEINEFIRVFNEASQLTFSERRNVKKTTIPDTITIDMYLFNFAAITVDNI
jgi:hypothetical protein